MNADLFDVNEHAHQNSLRFVIVGAGMVAVPWLYAIHEVEHRLVGYSYHTNDKVASGDWTDLVFNIGGLRGPNLDTSDLVVTQDWQELIRREDVEVVFVCVPTDMHYEVGMAVAEAGKHCVMEKPICSNSDEAEGLMVAFQNAGKTLIVDHCLPFFGAYKRLETWIRANQAQKKIKSFRMRRAIKFDGNVDTNKRMGGWAKDLGIHETHFLACLFGKPVKVEVKEKKDHDGYLQYLIAELTFANDIVVHIEVGAFEGDDQPEFECSFEVEYEDDSRIVYQDSRMIMFGLNDKIGTEVTTLDSDATVDIWVRVIEQVEKAVDHKDLGPLNPEFALTGLKVFEQTVA